MRTRTLLIPFIAALLMTGCGDTRVGSGMVNAGVMGSCPSSGQIGEPILLRATVTNEGQKPWPASYWTFLGGLDSFVTTPAGGFHPMLAHAGWTSFTGPELRSGETAEWGMTLIPHKAGNINIRFAAWGGKPNEQHVPNTLRFVGCSIAINP